MTPLIKIKTIQNINFLINFILVLFNSSLIYLTTQEICESFGAREFIERAQYLPIIPWKVPLYCIILMILLGISNAVKERYKEQRVVLSIMLCSIDLLIGIILIYYLNFSYKGIILLIISNIILYIKENKVRLWILLAALIIYSIYDYELLSVKMNIISINQYVNYYPEQMRFTIYAIKNIFVSLNEVCFIVFLFLLLQNKISENKAIQHLNGELRKTAKELKVANIKLEIYAKESEENAKMKERNRLAREIHDIIGHSLTSITTGLEACYEIININPDKAKEQLGKILGISKKGLLEVRRSVRELKTDALSQSELLPAIENLVKDINECTQTEVKLNISGTTLRLKYDEEQTIYRIIQESITNAIRHGIAKGVEVNLYYGEHEVKISIIDNGKGCAYFEQGFGLTHIKERVQILHGEVQFESALGQGFKTLITIPVRWGNAYD